MVELQRAAHLLHPAERQHHDPVGLQDTEEFASVILRNERTSMNLSLVEEEVIAAARSLKAGSPEIRSVVLECTDLPPYAARIQAELKLPVFDIVTLAEMAHRATTRSIYSGVMPW